jgi:peroxiredoxin
MRLNFRWPWGVVIALMFMVTATQTAYSAVGLTDLEGNRVHFSDYVPADKWLVVMIWSWSCPICAQEMAGQAQLHDRHQGGRLNVLGISMDGAEGIMEAWAFAEEHGARFPNLIGEGSDVAQFFHEQTGQSLQGTPTFLVYAPGGRLKAVQAGAVPPEGIEAFIADQEGAGG